MKMRNDLPEITLQDNTSQRLPVVLLLDVSGSMAGAAINELNESLKLLEAELKGDPIASQRVQILLIEFGGLHDVAVISEWVDAMDFVAPTLTASGSTPMGTAVRLGLDKLEEQKSRYRNAGIPYNRPWVFLITDGDPTDQWEQIAHQSKSNEAEGKFIFFGIGVGAGASLSTLARFSSRQPVRVRGARQKVHRVQMCSLLRRVTGWKYQAEFQP
jgi:uncharacterized protein YegL